MFVVTKKIIYGSFNTTVFLVRVEATWQFVITKGLDIVDFMCYTNQRKGGQRSLSSIDNINSIMARVMYNNSSVDITSKPPFFLLAQRVKGTMSSQGINKKGPERKNRSRLFLCNFFGIFAHRVSLRLYPVCSLFIVQNY